ICVGVLLWCFDEERFANSFADALYVLRHTSADDLAQLQRAEWVSFEQVASQYRQASPKPALPLEAQRYAAQANDAVERHQYQDAIASYREALLVAQWWPAGHYNLALLLANQDNYDGAVSEMNKYLALLPEAPDASAARKQVWIWEGRERTSK